MRFLKTARNTLYAAALTSALFACGGGGGSSKTPTTPSSSSHSPSSSSLSSVSSSSSSNTSTAYCNISGSSVPICPTTQNDWAYENGQYCVGANFCPTARSQAATSSRPNTLITANPSAATQAVFDYLNEIWGEKTLSGQMDLSWNDTIDMAARVHTDTNEYPAIMGYDFMSYGMTASWVMGLQQAEEAIDYWRNGGLVTFAWHWRDPSKLGTSDVNKAEFYTTKEASTPFRIPVKNGELDTSSSDYTAINAGIDLIAVELKKLQSAGVPVLWRPLHEASGGWFWWGASRADGVPPAFAQILLWRHLVDRLTQHHKLDNLIWVWNGQHAAWYPGDAYVDILSQDIYASNTLSQKSKFTETTKYSGTQKLIALSENGRIPNPNDMYSDGAHWLWFLTWNDTDKDNNSDNFWSVVNTLEHRKAVYSNERIINRDDLPNFSNAD